MDRPRFAVAAAALTLLAFGAGAGALTALPQSGEPGGTTGPPDEIPRHDAADRGVAPNPGSVDTCPSCGSVVPSLSAPLSGDLAAVLLVAVLAVAAAFSRSSGRPGDGPTADAAETTVATGDSGSDTRPDRADPAPDNPVYRAWLTMAREAAVADPTTATPREVAVAAREAGLDDEAAVALTDLFAAVRYGGRPVTETRAQRARELADRLEVSA